MIEPGNVMFLTNNRDRFKVVGASFANVFLCEIQPCSKRKNALHSFQVAQALVKWVFSFLCAAKHIWLKLCILSLANRILLEPAEKSMSGASGRQRANLNSYGLEVAVLSLPLSAKFASILSAYDDLIETTCGESKYSRNGAKPVRGMVC